MSRPRFTRTMFPTLLLILAHTPAGWSQSRPPLAIPSSGASSTTASQGSGHDVKNETTCAIYALKDLGDDPKLGEWIAETIPQVIQPGSWDQKDTKHRITYYPQGKVLVVYHNAAVHTEVVAFLNGLKKSAAAGEGKDRDAGEDLFTRSEGNARSLECTRRRMPVAPSPSYPVPQPLAAPKHLFHMIVRAEGVGNLGSTGLIQGFDGSGRGHRRREGSGQARGEQGTAHQSVGDLHPSLRRRRDHR